MDGRVKGAYHKNQQSLDNAYSQIAKHLKQEITVTAKDQESKARTGDKKTMASIKEAAELYVAPQTLNIADLDKVDVNMNTEVRTFKEGTDDEFSITVAIIEGLDYRIPPSVLGALKEILEEKPDLKYFKVKKKGEGLNTKYTVIPLE